MSGDIKGDSDNTPTEYTEKIWGKDEGGEHIIDGFVFTGKRVFKKAVDGLKEVMKKGAQNEICETKFKVLDARQKGAGLEIEVELVDKGSRGVGVVKLYGPNTRKEYVVTVTKSKGSENKYVTLLAENIVKPLMTKFLSGDDDFNLEKDVIQKTYSAKKNTKTLFKCQFCEKVLKSPAGLKCHITKLHKHDKKVEPEIHIEDSQVKKNEEILLCEPTDAIDDSKLSHDANLEELNDMIDLCKTDEKKYRNKCEECDFLVEGNRKYELIKLILKHKESCVLQKSKRISRNRNCSDCDFEGKDEMNMKRHQRDKHDIMTCSNSPPPKKKKNFIDVNDISEEMEIDEKNDGIEDLSFKLEDMEIDSEKDELEERSKIMDEKLTAKNKRIEEEERVRQEKVKTTELKKKRDEGLNIEKIKKQNKLRKQTVKDEKKKRKKENPVKKDSLDKLNKKIPNIRPVPRNCSHLVKKGDVVFVVPGDGSCGPNCASAFLFEDEVFGPKLRLRMNRFMAKHWNRRYQYLTQCSEKHPFVRKLGEGEIKYTDPLELIEYLMTSEKAAYMWSDSEDLAVISDMYQVTIKVITTKGENDVPTVNQIYPVETMKEFAELKNVQLDEMVLLHEKDMHFNLIVSGESDLATVGSLSYRSNIGPLMEENEEIEVKAIHEEKDDEYIDPKVNSLTEIENLQKELKKTKKSKKVIELEYSKCEKALKN